MAVKKKNTSNVKATKPKREKPPPLDQWIKPAIGIVIALVGYQFFQGLVRKEISRINIQDELELRQVLCGEGFDDETPKNYVVLCHSETATYPISSVFVDAAASVDTTLAEFRILDCDLTMAGSEKSVKERFTKQLNDKTRPLVFVSGKSMTQPKQVCEENKRERNM